MFRYWDGQSWSDQTTPDPSAPPPGQAAPPPPAAPTQLPPAQQQYPQQQYGQVPSAQQPAQRGQYPGGYGGGYGQGYPGSPGDSGGGTGKRIGLIALAVLLIAGLAVGGFFLVRTLTDADDSTADDSSQTEGTDGSESPTEESPTESPTDESPTEESPTEATPAGDPCTGGAPGVGGSTSANGRIRGGDLELPPVSGFDPVEIQLVSTFTFADEVAAVGRQIEEGWIALYSVGGLPRANGYTDLAASADQVITCMSESPNFYRNFTERNDLERESVQVDGHDAYSVTTELRIDDPDVQVDGDVAKVIVVDTGDDDSFGIYVSVVPIGDQKLINQQEAATRQLKVID
jgi:uncharacterized protein DUF2510